MKVGNPLGLGLIIVGAAAVAIAAFLPLDEPTNTFARVTDNTLIQHGGWLLIAAALGIAASGYRVSQGRGKERWGPLILCVIAAGLIVLNANDKSLRTLYPVRLDGTVDTSQPGMVASLGIAIYVAGAGVAAAFIGALMLLQREDAEETRVVPTSDRNGRMRERADQPRPQVKRQPAALEAEAEAAEAEALAAEARARAIRLRCEAQGKAKPAASPQNSKPLPGPAVKQKPPPGVLAPGAPVKVVAAGDEHEGQVGVVRALFNKDEDGLDVCVNFQGDNEVYAFSRDELSVVVPQPKAIAE